MDHRGASSLITASLLTLIACGGREVPPSPPPTSQSPDSAPPTQRVVGPLSEADAKALATMHEPLKNYVELHVKVERTLPKLPKEATPKQIDQNQRLLEQRLREERANAKPGNTFTPEAQPVIKRLLSEVFGGPDGKQLKASIMDENPVSPATMKLTVNARYPDTVPLTTIPPKVLQVLPKLIEDLEYRFVGRWLILLDVHAHLIVDFIPDALPE